MTKTIIFCMGTYTFEFFHAKVIVNRIITKTDRFFITSNGQEIKTMGKSSILKGEN